VTHLKKKVQEICSDRLVQVCFILNRTSFLQQIERISIMHQKFACMWPK